MWKDRTSWNRDKGGLGPEGDDINVHKLDFITRETQKSTSNPFVKIDVDFENDFNSVPHENLWTVLRTFEIPDIDLLESIGAFSDSV